MTCKQEEEQHLGQYSLPAKKEVLLAIYNVLTLEDMNYMSGIQSPFHHTPQRPHGGIHLHSTRVYTLW